MEPDLTSGDLARATGCTVRAIRFYEQQGLLAPAVLSPGGHRRYTGDHLERLRLIADLRELGLALSDIRAALALRAECTTAAELALRFQETLLGQIAVAERRLERLRRLKKELEAALDAIRTRLARGEASCPCQISDAAASPRIVRLLASGGLCTHVSGAGPSGPASSGSGSVSRYPAS